MRRRTRSLAWWAMTAAVLVLPLTFVGAVSTASIAAPSKEDVESARQRLLTGRALRFLAFTTPLGIGTVLALVVGT
jgi:hypothetical protein